jgi:Domain of unknown function (DUF4905)
LNLFSLFSSTKLETAWSYESHGHLWRILFGGKGHIAGEVRDHEKKTVSFFCLQEASGRPLWEDRTMPEPWWVGIEAVHRDTLILHGFEKPDLPEHRRIIALDLETGAQRWINEDLTFWFAYQDRIYAHQTLFEKRAGYVLSLETGEILETHPNGVEGLFEVRQLARQEDQAELFRFPSVFEPSSEPTQAESRLLKLLKHKTVVGNIESLRKDSFMLCSYHIQSSEKEMENRILILDDRRGGELFSDVLARNVPAPVPDSFFLKDSTVYFVKDQKRLVAITLPEEMNG